jgi:spermidine/putrescine-binding protein
MAQHEREDKAFRELAKQQMKQQMEQFKESKMTIFDYMTKVIIIIMNKYAYSHNTDVYSIYN